MLINKLLFLFATIKNMRSKNTFLFLLVSFFLLFAIFANPVFAQIKKGSNPKHRSFYLSAGYNKEKYFNSTIKVAQPTLGNDYSLLKVKADALANVKSIFPWQLNYRLGYYFNYDQTCGVELNYDPVNYHITNGQNVQLKGTYNNQPNTNSTIPFTKNGYYYGMDGANFILLNFVRRFTIYRPNSNRVGIDAIAKAGVGPLMPHFVSSLPVNNVPVSTFNDPQFRLKGWNAGTEAALRITVYRYGYMEIAGKYDYAAYNNLKVYDGTVKQNLNTLEVIASLGVTIPTNRYNPLFHHEKNIITIIPFFMDKKMQDSTDKADAAQKRTDGKESEEISDIPEFGDLVDKRKRKEDQVIADSIAKQQAADKLISDSIASKNAQDSTANQVIADSLSNIRMIDSIAQKAMADSITATMPIDSSVIKPPVDTTRHEETKKERKARLKKEAADKKEQEQKAQEQKDAAQNNANAPIPDAKAEPPVVVPPPDQDKVVVPPPDQEQKDKDKQELDKQAEKDKKAADKQAEKGKKAAEKQAKKDAKAAEKQAKKDAKEKEKKDKEEQAAKEKEEEEKNAAAEKARLEAKAKEAEEKAKEEGK
jgi:opacity protein-like surface antigen